MKGKNWRAAFFAVALFLLAAGGTVGSAAEKAPFYQGKTLTILINFAPGGPTDVEGRVMAKHLSKHIPGKPQLIMQNMGGGGGVIAVNYMGEVIKPNGLTVGYFTGALFHQQVREPNLRVDLSKFGFISGVQGVTVSYVRSDLPPGIKNPADFLKAERFKAAGLSVASSKDVRFRLSFDLLGLKYDYVTGYNSSSIARLAVQRGEAHYHDETLPGYRTGVEPQMVKTGIVTPLYYTDLVSFDGNVVVSADVPELLPFTHYYKKAFGKDPSGLKYEALKAANMSSTNMTRMIVLPPGAPAEAIAALRQGITGLSKDGDFIAEAQKTMRFHPRFEIGEQGERTFQRAAQIPAEVVNFLRKYIEEANR